MKQLEEKQNKVKAEKPAYCLCGKCINGIHPTDNFENRIIEELTQGIEEPYKLAMASAIHSALASQREETVNKIKDHAFKIYSGKNVFIDGSTILSTISQEEDLIKLSELLDIINNLTAKYEKQGM